ncbi:uncharacterized protein K460DRAFT_335139 [Cucurbitaria berberidis CBS 394.84]|uniref:DUF6590 domain-containing protein n=1 Tax=Cucurbitaria berberidis CBS 394.84 TaxID=1168544 RepID=A0A9P4LBU9_9PLEO|nr:uncharacterized protein K460DRAFT_335139 [Cucurbitaria berberidis CBS 394.84]KAF1848722.1 hypothetical protein K460DRAFT_335139 [Cucurbitaria berberidis CBS 394.84]
MANNGYWTWSPPDDDYYHVTYDVSGTPMYQWAKQANATTHSRARHDSVYQDPPTDPVPQDIRAYLPGFIAGTPDRGWTEDLDQSYKMRTGREAWRFFQVGKVFAMLYSEPAGAQSNFGNDDAYSYVRFNQVVYSTIRRFIVAEVHQGFVYACAISTYSNRGTLKPGCIPAEHSIVYFTGTDPRTCFFEGENGMTKEPIAVIRTDEDDRLVMKPESRVRFGKKFPIEKNVKVKDIGQVHPQHMSKFSAYYAEY